MTIALVQSAPAVTKVYMNGFEIGHTYFDGNAFQAWSELHGFGGTYADEDTGVLAIVNVERGR